MPTLVVNTDVTAAGTLPAGAAARTDRRPRPESLYSNEEYGVSDDGGEEIDLGLNQPDDGLESTSSNPVDSGTVMLGVAAVTDSVPASASDGRSDRKEIRIADMLKAGEIKRLSIKLLLETPENYVRSNLEQEVVDGYSNAMNEGAKFPAPVVYFEGKRYCVGDGWHTIAACRKQNRDFIEVDLRQGGASEALLYSVTANQKHGLRLSNSDKQRAIDLILADDELSRWSDRQIAKWCGLSDKTVASRRPSQADAKSHCGNSAVSERLFVSKHGTVAAMNPKAAKTTTGQGAKPVSKRATMPATRPPAEPSRAGAERDVSPDPGDVANEAVDGLLTALDRVLALRNLSDVASKKRRALTTRLKRLMRQCES